MISNVTVEYFLAKGKEITRKPARHPLTTGCLVMKFRGNLSKLARDSFVVLYSFFFLSIYKSSKNPQRFIQAEGQLFNPFHNFQQYTPYVSFPTYCNNVQLEDIKKTLNFTNFSEMLGLR